MGAPRSISPGLVPRHKPQASCLEELLDLGGLPAEVLPLQQLVVPFMGLIHADLAVGNPVPQASPHSRPPLTPPPPTPQLVGTAPAPTIGPAGARLQHAVAHDEVLHPDAGAAVPGPPGAWSCAAA